MGGVLLSGLAVAATGGTLLGLETLAGLVAAWRADLRLVAILREPPARPEAPEGVVASARSLPGVGVARYVPPAEALAALRRYLGGVADDDLDQLPTNPVPARLEIAPAATLDAAGLRDLVAALGRLRGVEEVQAAVGWVAQVERIDRGLRIGGLALGSLLGLGAILAITGATIAARRGRADETAVLRLCGASEVSIWGPLLLQSVVQGVVGAVLAGGALLLASEAGPPWVAGWLRTVVALGPLPTPPWPLLVGFMGGGLTMGLVGGLAAGRP